MYEIKIEKGSVPVTRALETAILRRVEWLKRFCPDVLRCWVSVTGPGPHHRHGAYRFKLIVHVRRGQIAAEGRPAADLRTALASAFHVARRRLEDHVRDRRQMVKTHDALVEGHVAHVARSGEYGFLEARDGHQVYFHRSSVLAPFFMPLAPGLRARWSEEQGEKGPQASTVHLVATRRMRRAIPGRHREPLQTVPVAA